MFCQDQVSVALYVLCWIFYDSISIRDTCADVGRDVDGGPWVASPDSNSCNGDGNECNILYCQSDSNPGCVQFTSAGIVTRFADGVPCGTDLQCWANQCTSPALLSPDFQWGAREPWDDCDTCGTLQYTDIHCYYQPLSNPSAVRITVNDSACAPEAKLSNSRQCQNVTLGCAYNTDPDDTHVELFGQTIQKNTLMFGVLGSVALIAVVLACCYQGVTYGHDGGKEDDVTPEASEFRKATVKGRKQSQPDY